jgi:hypothetical protein
VLAVQQNKQNVTMSRIYLYLKIYSQNLKKVTNAYQLFMYRCFMSQLNKVEICFNGIQISVCVCVCVCACVLVGK